MTNPTHTKPHGVDLERIRALAEPLARAAGAEVVAVEWKTEGRGFVLRVLVEKAGSAERRASTEEAAIDLEVCATISRGLSAALDEADPIPSHYSLEVGSPGVERELRGPEDYARFAGKKARLKLRADIGGQRVHVGVLGPVDAGAVSVDVGGRALSIPFAQIVTGRLVFELASAQKPGKQRPRK